MPNISRFSADSVLNEVEDLLNSGVNSIALFPVIEESKKDDLGKEALNKSNLILNQFNQSKKVSRDYYYCRCCIRSLYKSWA